MTNLRTHRLFTFVPPQSRDGGSSKKLGLPAMICIVCLFCAAAAIAAPAQSVSFTSLYSFCWIERACAGGFDPYSQLVQATDGNFYGTSNSGGETPSCRGCGAIFKITPAGATTTFYNFCAQSGCPEGSNPMSGVIQATDGNFYGTTSAGGAYNLGTIFKITPEGTLTTLQSFGGSYGYSLDASFSELVEGSDGNFYGTTAYGGNRNNCPPGCGTIFRITPTGTMSTLYTFCTSPVCWDGYYPIGGLVQGSDGNFCGTTAGDNGGTATVFKITPTGTLTTLHNFFYPDGFGSTAALVQGVDGNFYGTTAWGGLSNVGTVFKITPEGELTTLYSFGSQANCADGCIPYGGLVQASDGNFYGTTSAGGTGAGTVFKITATGTLTTLHNFDVSDGASPYAGLVQAVNGSFYGTTCGGGADGVGTVFRLGVTHNCATCRP